MPDDFVLARWVAASRAAQDLPPKVEDEDVLLEVAYRVLGLLTGEGGGGRGPAA